MATFSSKKEIVERLRKQISEKDSTAINTLMLVYAHQLEDEQKLEIVKYHNGIGFRPQDARLGCSLAKWYEEKGFFTPKQIVLVKRIAAKYAGQVVETKISSGHICKSSAGWEWL